MRKIFQIIILLIIIQSFLLWNPCYSQYDNSIKIDNAHIIIKYMLEYHQDSTNLADKNGEEMLLFIGNKVSLFMSYNSAISDTVKAALLRAEQKGVDSQIFMDQYTASGHQRSRFRYRIYKNFAENNLTYHEYIPQNFFFYEEPLNGMKWKLISGEERVIKNYKVKKATTYYGGREWIAWFTPDIPINNGPYKFNGLPGLIVKIEDSRGHYAFTLLSFETLNTLRPIERILGNNEVKTSRGIFLKTVENLRANMIPLLQDAQFSTEAQRILSGNARRRNNPIELRAD
jgi:GLPGLI family protein